MELTLGGPIAPGHRRPLSFKLEPLAPAGSTAWESELRVSGFGWPAVQPAIFLPVKVCREAGWMDGWGRFGWWFVWEGAGSGLGAPAAARGQGKHM